MAKYDKKAALKIMIEAVKQYEEKLNDKQFLIIYRERKDIKTVNVGFRDMNFLHMTGVKTRLSAQQFYAACLESKLSEYDFEIDNKGKRGTEEKGRIVTKNKTITGQSERRECYGTFHCTSECDFKM